MKPQKLLTWLLTGIALILTLNLTANHYLLYALLPLAKALYLLFTMLIYGYLALRFFYKKKKKTIELTPALALGVVLTTFLFFLLAWFKILIPWVIVLYYVGPLPLFLVLIRPELRSDSADIKEHQQSESVTGDQGAGGAGSKAADPAADGFLRMLKSFCHRPAVEYLVFLFPLIYAVLPPSFYDSLAYHLGIPNLYLQNAGFIATPQLFYANTFIYYEISLIPAVFAGDLVPRLFHFLLGAIFILSAVDFAVEHFKITKRTIVLLTIISMPMTVFLLTAVKNDLLCAWFVFLGAAQFLKGNKYLSALFWGYALGVKYTNIVPLGVFLLLFFIKERRIPFKQMVIFALIIAAVLIPLLLKNYVYTGNPIFPFLHGHFENKLPYWDASRFTLLEQDAKKLFYSWKDVIRYPFTVSFGELGSGGIVGPLFLMFLPFLLVKKEKRLFLLFFSILTLVIGANFKLSIRVWAAAFIFLAMYVAIAYETLGHKVMKVLFFIIIGVNAVGAFGLQEYLNRSFNVFTGKLGSEEYKAFTFPTYSGIAFVNEKTPPGTRVLLVGEAKSYYLKRPYYVSSGYDFSILKKYLDKGGTPAAFVAALRADGIEYIILNIDEFHRLQQSYKNLTEEEFSRALYFLKSLAPVYRDEAGAVLVLRI